MSFTIGSLFDGSGGFPLAAFMCGGVPVWASEVAPYPIAVTKSRFPYMKHLGDISKVNGAEIEPVDVISFGSPCQDLSVAGKRAGLKHEDNGDDETTRSGLFMEAVRIIKEMREKTNGEYPRFAVWENVNGAFSSNKGEDFRVVLEELIKIVEPTASVPSVPPYGWAYADSYVGDGWSLAYRVFDAQYWGVPQRRRRIYLVLDLRGQRARKVLFEREGLWGHFEESRAQGQGIAADAENGARADDSAGRGVALCYDARGNGDGDTVNTITGDHNNRVTDYTGLVVLDETVTLEGNGQRPSHNGDGWRLSDKSYTLNTTEVHGVAYAEQPIVLDRAFYNQGQNALYEPQYYDDGSVPTIVAKGPSAVAYWDGTQTAGTLTARNAGGAQRMPDKENFNCVIQTEPRYIVRRLTPTECARLQGFMDEWGHPDIKSEFTDEDYDFWLSVYKTSLEIEGKKPKVMTRDRLLRWYNKLHTDSSEYKMWGNGIAFPCALYVMQGIAEAI